MTLYLLGNLVGRLFVCYVLVWLVMFCVVRFDWRLAFRRTVTWYGILATLVLFGIGVFASARAGNLL